MPQPQPAAQSNQSYCTDETAQSCNTNKNTTNNNSQRERTNNQSRRRLCSFILIAVLCALSTSSSSLLSVRHVFSQSLESAASSELIIPNSICSSPSSFVQSVIHPHTYYLLCLTWSPGPSFIIYSDIPLSGSSTILLPLAPIILNGTNSNFIRLEIGPAVKLIQTSSGVIYFPVTISNNSRTTDQSWTMIFTYTPTITDEGQMGGQLTSTANQSLPTQQCINAAAVTLMPTQKEDILLLGCYVPHQGIATAIQYYRFNLSSFEFIDPVSHPLLTWYNASWGYEIDFFSHDANDTLITIDSGVYRVKGDSNVIQLLLTNNTECPWITSTLQDRVNDILIVRCSPDTTLGVGSTLIGWRLDPSTGQPIEGSSHSILSSVDCQQPSFTWYYRNLDHPSIVVACYSGIGSLLLIQDIMSDHNRTSRVLFSNDVCQLAIQVVRDQFHYSMLYLTCADYGIFSTSGIFAFVEMTPQDGCQRDLDWSSDQYKLRSLAFDARRSITFLLCDSESSSQPLLALSVGQKIPISLNECHEPVDIVIDDTSQLLFIGCLSYHHSFDSYSIESYEIQTGIQSTIYNALDLSQRLIFTGQQLYVIDNPNIHRFNQSNGTFDQVHIGLPHNFFVSTVHDMVVCSSNLFYTSEVDGGNTNCTLFSIPLNATIKTNATLIWSNLTVNDCVSISTLVCHTQLQIVLFAAESILYRIDANTLNISIEYSHLPQFNPAPSNQVIWSKVALDETNHLLLLTLSAIYDRMDYLLSYDLVTRYLATVPTSLFLSYFVDVAVDPLTRSIIYRTAFNMGSSRAVLLTEGFACTQGYEWNSGQCQQCSIGSARGVVKAGQSQIKLPQCQPCAPGRYGDVNGLSICRDCEVGRASSIIAAQICAYCQPGRFMNETGATECIACQIGSSQSQINSTECIPCRTGSYASIDGRSQCEVCQIDTYSPDTNLPCHTCTDDNQEGLQCRNGLVSVLSGWWPYLENVTIDDRLVPVYRTTRCPDNYCPGASLQPDSTTTTTTTSNSNSSSRRSSFTPTLCQWPRLNSPDNWLCADCVDGYIAWGSSCQECQHANIGLIIGVLVLSCVLVYLLYRIDPSSSPLTILVFFIQISALELGSVTRWIDWIQFANFGSHSFSTCFAPLTPSQQMLVTLCIPFILLVILSVLCLIHWLLSCCFSSQREYLVESQQQNARYSFFHQIARHATRLLRWLSLDFNRDRYIGGSIAILIFCYTSTVVTVVKSLHCIEIAPGVSRLFQVPTIDCHSNEYHLRLLPSIYCWLIVYVCGLPMFMFVFVWKRWHRVAHIALSSDQQHGRSYFSNSSIADVEVDALSSNRGSLNQSLLEEKEDTPLEKSSIIRSPSLIAFNYRWGHLYRPYRFTAWYWQPLEMLQRFIFALISVIFIEYPYVKYSIYMFIILLAFVSHIATRPFVDDRMNHINSISYLLLAFISLLMIAQHPPYTLGTQIVFFLLVVPFSAILFVWGVRRQYKKFVNRTSYV